LRIADLGYEMWDIQGTGRRAQGKILKENFFSL
jgi:hypothetical protein